MSHQQPSTGYLSKKRIAYVMGMFPMLTTTFIDREILEAKGQGVDLVLTAIWPPSPFEMSAKVKKLAAETKYILPVSWLSFVGANVYFILTRPWSYLTTLLYLLTRRYETLKARLKTLFYFAEGVRAAALLKSEQINHIHAHFADRTAVVALVAARLLKVPYSVTAHAYDIYVSPILLPEKVANAKFVTTCTGYNKAYLERLTGRQIELIYHGLDLAAMKPGPQPALNGHPSLILSVGQLKEKKGFPYLIRACRLLRNQNYNFKCEIIGEGPDRTELEALIAELNLQDTVTLCGALPNYAVMARYTQATLFALPCIVAGNADRDGIPNVLLEAMAHGLPVISTRLSGIPEVIEDGVTGLLIEAGDVDALAMAIITVLDDSELRERLSRQGRQQVEEKFDIQKNIARLVELLTADSLPTTHP